MAKYDKDDPAAILGAAWEKLTTDAAKAPAEDSGSIELRLEKLLRVTIPYGNEMTARMMVEAQVASDWAKTFRKALEGNKALHKLLVDSSQLRRVVALAEEKWKGWHKQHIFDRSDSADVRRMQREVAVKGADMFARMTTPEEEAQFITEAGRIECPPIPKENM